MKIQTSNWAGTEGFLYCAVEDFYAHTAENSLIEDPLAITISKGESIFYLGKGKICLNGKKYSSSIFHDFLYDEKIIKVSVFQLGKVVEVPKQNKK